MRAAIRIVVCLGPFAIGCALSLLWLAGRGTQQGGRSTLAFQPESIDLGLGHPGDVLEFSAVLVNSGNVADVFVLDSPSCNLTGLEPRLLQLQAGESGVVRGRMSVLGPGYCGGVVLARSQVRDEGIELSIALAGRDEPHLPVPAIPLGLAPGGSRTFEVSVPVYVGSGAWADAPLHAWVEGDLQGMLAPKQERVPVGYVVVGGSVDASRPDLHGVLDGEVVVRLDGASPVVLRGRLLCEVAPPEVGTEWPSCRIMLRNEPATLDLAGEPIQSLARERPAAGESSWVECTKPGPGESVVRFERRIAPGGSDSSASEDFLLKTGKGLVRVRVLDGLRSSYAGP